MKWEIGFYNRLLSARDNYGDITIVHDEKGDYTYSDLLSGIECFSNRLLDMGLKPGEHVGLCSHNSARWIMAYMGIVKAGGVAVLLNYSLPMEELFSLAKDMDCEYFFYGTCSARNKDSDFVCKIPVSEDKKEDINILTIWNNNSFNCQNLTEYETASPSYIIFSSGSYGNPKGVMQSQRTCIRGGDDYRERHPELVGETICIASPLFHNFALIIAVAHLLYGGKCVLPGIFTNDIIFNMIDSSEPSAIAAVMTIMIKMIDDKRIRKKAIHCIHRFYTAGAPLLPKHYFRVENIFDKITIMNDYGQSEAGFPIAVVCEKDSCDKKISSVGRPLKSRNIRILSKNGTECNTGETGEVVLINNEYITCGYYNYTGAENIDQNGYLHTEDLGFLDKEGYLHLTGRIKDIIIKGGDNITPVLIEKEVLSIDGICNVKILGAPDYLYGESVEACISYSNEYLKNNSPYSEEELKDLLKGKVSSFNMPSHFFVYDEFPIKSNGKLDVMKLRFMMLNDLSKIVDYEEIENELQSIMSGEYNG